MTNLDQDVFPKPTGIAHEIWQPESAYVSFKALRDKFLRIWSQSDTSRLTPAENVLIDGIAQHVKKIQEADSAKLGNDGQPVVAYYSAHNRSIASVEFDADIPARLITGPVGKTGSGDIPYDAAFLRQYAETRRNSFGISSIEEAEKYRNGIHICLNGSGTAGHDSLSFPIRSIDIVIAPGLPPKYHLNISSNPYYELMEELAHPQHKVAIDFIHEELGNILRERFHLYRGYLNMLSPDGDVSDPTQLIGKMKPFLQNYIIRGLSEISAVLDTEYSNVLGLLENNDLQPAFLTVALHKYLIGQNYTVLGSRDLEEIEAHGINLKADNQTFLDQLRNLLANKNDYIKIGDLMNKLTGGSRHKNVAQGGQLFFGGKATDDITQFAESLRFKLYNALTISGLQRIRKGESPQLTSNEFFPLLTG